MMYEYTTITRIGASVI